MSVETLDLTKELDLRKQKVLDLRKSLGLNHQKAQVVLALDFSGSMSSMYSSGKVQQLVERLLPIGMAFDDNQEIDFYLFHDSFEKLPENIKPNNIAGYIQKKVLGKYDMGGTSYAPIIKEIVDEFSSSRTKSSFLGIGGGKEYTTMDMPVYVIFITDVDNFDKKEAEEAIKEASKTGIFFQFVGIGGTKFPFLEKLDTMSGRNIDNANFFAVEDVTKMSDDDLYKLLLTEFPTYVHEARSKKLIK